MSIHRADLTVTKAEEKATRTLEFIASTDVVDRQGDIIEQRWQLKSFRKNPVFLWGHEHGGLPIGKIVKVWTQNSGEKAAGRAKKETRIQVEFVPAEVYPFAEQVFQLYKAGFLKAVSVGFRPLKRENMSAEERQALGLGPWGERILESELLEVSAVSVPANQDALLTSVSKGLLTEDAATELRSLNPEDGLDRDRLNEAIAAIDSAMETRAFEEPTTTEVEEEPEESGDPETEADPADANDADPAPAADVERRLAEVEVRLAELQAIRRDAADPGEEPSVGDDGDEATEPGSESQGQDDAGEEVSEETYALYEQCVDLVAELSGSGD